MVKRSDFFRRAVTSVALALPAAAFAAGGPASDAAANKGDGLEEIVVTAQKREERLQDVPITVSAITAQTAQMLGVNGTQDLASAVPGLIFNRSSFSAAPSIRGIGSIVIAQGDESTVGIYVDGVLQVSPTVGVFSLNNIERVEVLKGPQGTLFGRNSTGGVINILTKTPSKTTGVDVSVGYGNYNTAESNLYATTGLGEHAAVDFAAYLKDQDHGWGRDLTYNTDINKDKEADLRSKLYLEVNDTTKATISATFIHTADSRAGAFRLLQGTTSATGSTYSGFYNVESNVPDPTNRQQHYDINVRLEHDMDWASLLSITSYQHSRFHWDYDVDGTGVDLIRADVVGKDRAITEEFQILSPKGQRLEWIAGLYYLHADSVFNPGNAYLGGGTVPFQVILGGQTTDSWAGFGQGTLELLPKLRLTLGLRYTADKREIDAANVLPPAFGGLLTRVDGKVFDQITYRAALDYKPTDAVLTYASVTTGFKAGRFATDQIFQPALNPESLRAYEIGVKSQFLDNHLQLNASGFYYDYKNLQQSVLNNSTIEEINAGAAHLKGVDIDLNVVPVRNLTLQAAVSYLDAKYVDFPGAPSYPLVPDGSTSSFNAGGKYLTRAPKWNSLFTATYAMDTAIGSVDIAGSYNLRSRYYWDFQNTTAEPTTNMINSSVTWTDLSEHYSVGLWAKNMLNEKRHVYVVPGSTSYISMPGEPFTFGITLRARF